MARIHNHSSVKGLFAVVRNSIAASNRARNSTVPEFDLTSTLDAPARIAVWALGIIGLGPLG